MRSRTAAVLAAAILLPLSACSTESTEPAEAKPAPTSKGAVDCTDQRLSQAEYMEHCHSAAPQSPAAPTVPQALGKPAATIGADAESPLELTPSTVVYLDKTATDTPENDAFAFVAIKLRPTGATAAEQTVPALGAGWKWVAPDGQAISASNGAALNVVADSFNSGGEVQPGTYQWDGLAFDLTTAQKGGTLLYTDGAGTAFQWKMPAADAGPQMGAVKKELVG